MTTQITEKDIKDARRALSALYSAAQDSADISTHSKLSKAYSTISHLLSQIDAEPSENYPDVLEMMGEAIPTKTWPARA
jgi:hypothetical protein